MKFFLLFVLLFASMESFSLEPICTSESGKLLTLESITLKKDFVEFTDLKKILKNKFDSLCKSNKSGKEIITIMQNECRPFFEKGNDSQLAGYCIQGYKAAMAFQEGLEKGSKLSSNCEKTDQISNLKRDVKKVDDQIPSQVIEKSNSFEK
jgi:hypothetical protein